MAGIITELEKDMALFCIECAKRLGASGSRVSLSKNVLDSVSFFNGELDKVTHAADRSIYLYIFADGKYGTFSTNRIEKEDLSAFIEKAVATVKMLEKDECRQLPQKDRLANDALTGVETGLYDEKYFDEDIDSRIERVRKMSIFNSLKSDGTYSLISEECNWSDSVEDTLLIDSQGLEARHIETSAGCFCEMNVADAEGNKYSGYWWDSSFSTEMVDTEGCPAKALEKVLKQMGPKRSRGGYCNMVIDSSAASKLVSPIINALNASSIQQKMSFLEGTKGKKIFPENLTIEDRPRDKGLLGARYYDSEGVATENRAIIDKGVVTDYFINTYLSNKTGWAPTIEDISRPVMTPFIDGTEASKVSEVSLEDLLKASVNGFYITGFNGGNCNPVTGDFSFGVEGFKFSKGRITHPIKEMLITGNILELWNKLTGVGSDARPCTRWQIPSLAFKEVSFSS